MPGLGDKVFSNWAAAIALWALPYLTLRHHLGVETTEALQWSLVAIGVLGTIQILHNAWQVSSDRAWRASHGLLVSRSAK